MEKQFDEDQELGQLKLEAKRVIKRMLKKEAEKNLKIEKQFDEDEKFGELKLEVKRVFKMLEDLEPKTVEEMVTHIRNMAQEGYYLTYEEVDGEPFVYEDEKTERINVLFSDILNLCNMSLLPIVHDNEILQEN